MSRMVSGGGEEIAVAALILFVLAAYLVLAPSILVIWSVSALSLGDSAVYALDNGLCWVGSIAFWSAVVGWLVYRRNKKGAAQSSPDVLSDNMLQSGLDQDYTCDKDEDESSRSVHGAARGQDWEVPNSVVDMVGPDLLPLKQYLEHPLVKWTDGVTRLIHQSWRNKEDGDLCSLDDLRRIVWGCACSMLERHSVSEVCGNAERFTTDGAEALLEDLKSQWRQQQPRLVMNNPPDYTAVKSWVVEFGDLAEREIRRVGVELAKETVSREQREELRKLAHEFSVALRELAIYLGYTIKIDNLWEPDVDDEEDKQSAAVAEGFICNGGYQDWHEGAIVDAGIVKDCEVEKVLSTPVLHFYLWTPRGKRMTYFPFRGNRAGWTDQC